MMIQEKNVPRVEALTKFKGTVSSVSKAFPLQETGYSAYLKAFRVSVSAFPPFPTSGEGVSR